MEIANESNMKENLVVASRVEASNSVPSTPNSSSIGHSERNRLHGLPSKQYEMLDMEENQIIDHFASYVMNVYDLPHLGVSTRKLSAPWQGVHLHRSRVMSDVQQVEKQ